MFGLSNGVMGLLNFFTLCISVSIISLALITKGNGTTECDKFFHLPLLMVGMYLFVASFLGLIGSCCQATLLLKFYLGMLAFSIIGSLGLAIFAMVMAKGSEGMDEFVFNNEFRLDKISSSRTKSWVMNNRNWDTIKSCMVESRLCAELVKYDPMDPHVLEFVLLPIQGGCCKPPTHCGYTYQNTTFWEVPQSALPSKLDEECLKWSNNKELQCFDCSTCKAGFIGSLNDYWRELLEYNIFFIVVSIIFGTIARCALTNSQTRRSFKYRVYA